MLYEVVLLEPAFDFLSSLEAKLQAKAFRTIDLLRHFGPKLPMPHSKRLHGHDLSELRVRLGSTICRLFYFYHQGKLFVVTSGYIKKSEQTDSRQIERAIRLKTEYIRGDTQ